MQVYSSVITEVLTHVHQVVAGEVVRNIINKLGAQNIFKNKLYFNSDYTGASRSYNDRRLPILNENSFKCDIKYSISPFGLKWDSTTPGQHLDPAIHRRDNFVVKPIFYDPRHNIQIVERYQPCNITLDCRMVIVDKVVAFDLINRLMTTFVRGELLTLTDLSYDYRLPPEIMDRLYIMSKMIGLQKGSLLDWMASYSNGQIKPVVSVRQNNRHTEIVVKKQQFEALAVIDYTPDAPSQSSQGTSMDYVEIPFTVVVQFGRVNMLYLKYPIVLNNKLIPDSMVTSNPKDYVYNNYPLLQQTYIGLNEPYQQQKMLRTHPVRIPWYDDWLLPKENPITYMDAIPFLIGVFTLDNSLCCCDECKCDCGNKYTEINIAEDMEPYKLSKTVLDWFKEHPDKALDPLSLYSISVYADNTLLGTDQLQFDGTILKVPNCKGPRRTYRIIIAASKWDRDFEISPWSANVLLIDFDIQKERH